MLMICLESWIIMLKPIYTNRFLKDYDLAKKRGLKIDKLQEIMRKLVDEEQLSPKYRNHSLTGNYAERNECHIAPDWLLIYKIESESIIFERTGSHADLF